MDLKQELLALLLEEEGFELTDESAIRPREKSAYEPLSFAQQRLWFLGQMEPDSSAYNLFSAVRLTGNLQREALTQSFQELVARHEALRTSFLMVEGQPVQAIVEDAQVPFHFHNLCAHADAKHEAMRMVRDEALRPFDLTCAPLMRLLLLQVADDEHVLLVTMHHIISDGWSIGVFIQELVTMYNAFSAGERSPLPDLPIQYADFAVWQREWLQGEVLEGQLAYWKEKLGGQLPVLQLPTDRPRQPVRTFRGATEAFRLSHHLTQKLKDLCQHEGVTLYMALLAAFNTLLYRYTGQEDLVVGSPIANRNRAEIEGLIGFFVNTLVLRNQVQGEMTFRDFLQTVRQTALEAFEHQDLPFEKLVEELQPERNPSYSPLFQVMFVLQNAPQSSLNLSHLTMEMVELESDTAKFDLTLMLVEAETGLSGTLEYNTDLFDAVTIKRMLGHFENLLEAVTTDASQSLAKLPILTETERHQLLVEWNATETAYSKDASVHQLFEQQAAETPDAIALICGNEQLTYQQLNQRANQLTRHLIASGVTSGDRVVLFMERSLEMIVALLAVLKAGAAYVPLDPTSPKERLTFQLEEVQAPILLTKHHQLVQLPGDHKQADHAQVLCVDTEWQQIASHSVENVDSGATADDLAYIVYTSGSTGQPKGVLVPHRGVVRLVKETDYIEFSSKEVYLHLAPITFDAATFEIWGSLLNGASLVLFPPTQISLTELGQVVREQRVSTLLMTTGLFHQMVDHQLNDLSGVRQLLAGGDVLSVSHVQKVLQELPGIRLVNGYGPTESTTFTCCHPMTDLSQVGHSVSIGRPIANTEVYVLDEYLQPVPVGIAGELYIGGDGLALGYLNRPELTEERFVRHPFADYEQARLYKTGDIVRYLADGTLEFFGRQDNQVKIRGYRIELGEIETVLGQHPEVREAIVMAREDVPGEKRLVGYVLPAQESALNASELRGFLKRHLPEYMIPSVFVFLEQFPLTPNGKVDRRLLPTPDGTRPELAHTYTAPRNQTEETLAVIWSELLRVERVGIHDNFFELGGHSLLATQLMSRVSAAFGVQIPLHKLFEQSTLLELAGCIDEEIRAQRLTLAPPIVPVPRGDGMPLSFAQERMWFFEQFMPGTATYHIPGAMRLRGMLNVEALARSFQEIVLRHEALRTTFVTVEGESRQIISEPTHAPLNVVDLTQVPTSEREARAMSVAREEAMRPFDLTSGPLVRNVLLRLSETEHVLLVTMHHIVSDGWSIGVMVQELAALYEAFVQGQPSPLPELPVQYADFAQWQRQWLQGEVLEGQLSYWKEKLGGQLSVLQLPTDRPRQPVQTFRGATETLRLSHGLTQKLKDLCRHEGVTLYMTLLAAFNTLLYRYTGQEDLVVGSPIANRNRAEIEGLIGFFVNTLVLRNLVQGEMTFRDFLQTVRQTALEAFEHQDLPFEKLVEELQPERNPNYSPLFQVMFVLQNAPQSALNLSHLTMEMVELESDTAKFDLTLMLTEAETGLNGTLEYNTDLFDAATIKRMLGHFEHLLEAVTVDASQSLAKLPMLAEVERHQLLAEWNATGTAYPRDASVHQIFEQQVAETPEAIALICGNEQLTYQQLNQRANQLTRHLIASGVTSGDRVVLFMERSLEMIVALLAVLKAGAAYVPLDPTSPKERLTFQLEEVQAPILLTQQHLLEQLPTDYKQAHVLCVDTEWQQIASHNVENVDLCATADDLAYIVYTSGSTGQPKGALVPHRGVVRLVKETDYIEFSSQEVFLQLAPITFDAATFEIWGSLLNGATLVLFPPTQISLTELGQVVREQGVSTLWLTAGLFHQMVDHQLDDLRGVRQLVAGGDVLSVSHVQRVLQELPDIRLVNGYGPTESTTFTCCHPMTDLNQVGHSVSIGRPIANTEVYVLDEHLQPVPVGIAGELYIGGDGLALGYLNRPELTEEKFVRHPFSEHEQARLYKTGDIVRYLADGTLEFIGRQDNQVKVRGYRIELGEIETLLGQHPEVREAVVMVREDVPGEKRLVGYVLPQQESALNALELRGFLKRHLPEYMIPSVFVFLEQFPLTPNGKVDRRALPTPDGMRPELAHTYTAPRNQTEETLAVIWSELLRVERVGIHDNFFELGGHSLLATRLVSRVRQELAVDVPLRSLFEVATIAEVAQVIEVSRSKETEPEKPAITKRSRAAHQRSSRPGLERKGSVRDDN